MYKSLFGLIICRLLQELPGDVLHPDGGLRAARVRLHPHLVPLLRTALCLHRLRAADGHLERRHILPRRIRPQEIHVDTTGVPVVGYAIVTSFVWECYQ